MNAERWRKIEDIFQFAMDISGDERARFIERECAGDEAMRHEVERMISGAEDEEDFLESPAWTGNFLLRSELENGIADSLKDAGKNARDADFTGRQIGVYRITEEIGRGGMGVVYRAERTDGEFRQTVAIKLIRRGMDTDFILRRFRQERQIAATLNHPNIARLFDGGTTDDDLPYFVMEYVEGSALFKYVKARDLSLREKLELFLEICRPIAYAHKKRIVHRDIKPGNILVSEDGEPKLLDFGIAKILDPDLMHESQMPTETQMRLMTPEYASPEQVRGDEINEASDQYSLGVLLYELLTGERPYKFSSRAPHEIARIICEEMPSEPSSGAFGKFTASDSDARLFSEDYCKKLDRIVLKALRKNPAERYASVKELARDIERFLSGETIRAENFALGGNDKQSAQNDFEDAPSSASGQTPTITNQKSIAVLPFKILDAATTASADTGDGKFLGIGLADALITRLSNVRQFLVRPTSSILRYGERAEDSLSAGEELRVSYILDGSIIKTGARLRVSVQLLSVAEQTTVWAERFDEDSSDVLTLEDKISAKVADALVPHLTTGERQKLNKRGTDLPKAYEAYLRGRFYRNMFTDESLTKAFAAYREAISYDSEYALAFAGIADYYVWVGVNGFAPPTESYPLAKRAALRAIELDDGLADAYASLAFAQICGDFDWIEAEKNAARAVALNPNYSVARIWYSYILLTAGRFDEGLAQAKRAVELDPLSYLTHHVLMLNYFMARRFDEAIRQAAENVENFPDIGMAHHVQSWVLRNFGRDEESFNAMSKASELLGDNLLTLISRAQALAAAGRRRESEAVLERVFEQGKSQYLSYYQVAAVYAYLGDADKTFAALDRALADREGWLVWLGVEPAFDALRDDRRFYAFLERINHPTLKTIYKEKIREINLREVDARKSSAATTQVQEKSLAVLPFKILKRNTGEQTGEEEFLGIGLADALITRLSNVRQFLVRPTSSILRYVDTSADSLSAGEELKVRFVLDGSIIKINSRLRVSVQLLEISARTAVWAERFDEEMDDVLRLEDSISKRVAESLVPHLTRGEARDLAKRGTNNAAAYEAYLRGRFHWNTFTEDGFRQAFKFYQKAVELDPNYALAYAAIADFYGSSGVYGTVPAQECYPQARQAALRAIELDERLAEAHGALGLARLYGDYDWRQSELDSLRALDLNPNNATVRLWYSHNLAQQGRLDESLRQLERAVELDPLSFVNHYTLAWNYYFMRRYDAALAKIDDVIERFPDNDFAYFSKATFLCAANRAAEALPDIERALQLSNSSVFNLHGLAHVYATLGRRNEMLAIYKKIEAQAGEKNFLLYQTAVGYAILKDKETALANLTRAIENRESIVGWAGVQPSFDILRDDSSFHRLLKRINHPLADR